MLIDVDDEIYGHDIFANYCNVINSVFTAFSHFNSINLVIARVDNEIKK